jgi:diadenosine tetraphosphate (Ap4A) HIT family hydrolase
MKNFQLDKRLAKDCLVLGELDISLVLLMNNALLPWFILVPQVTVLEICDLDKDAQLVLYSEINEISNFVKAELDVEKLNVAAIGNIVKQLHVHIVGRKQSDYCWPNVVWGTNQKVCYSDEEVRKLVELLETRLGSIFKRSY